MKKILTITAVALVAIAFSVNRTVHSNQPSSASTASTTQIDTAEEMGTPLTIMTNYESYLAEPKMMLSPERNV